MLMQACDALISLIISCWRLVRDASVLARVETLASEKALREVRVESMSGTRLTWPRWMRSVPTTWGAAVGVGVFVELWKPWATSCREFWQPWAVPNSTSLLATKAGMSLALAGGVWRPPDAVLGRSSVFARRRSSTEAEHDGVKERSCWV